MIDNKRKLKVENVKTNPIKGKDIINGKMLKSK